MNDAVWSDQEWADQINHVNALIRHAAQKLPWDLYADSSHVHPVSCVQWIHISRIQANDWNPNSVAHKEMGLLHTSISEDGYTQPVVAIFDPDIDKFIIVDGFHRYSMMRLYPDIAETTRGYLPVVVLDKPPADRMASTVRHNRARGKHSVAGMGHLVFQMLMAGETDESICNKIGLEPGELARLKHVTGYSRLYKDAEYGPLVMTATQIAEKASYAQAHPDEQIPQF